MRHFILTPQNRIVEEPDLLAWARWMENNQEQRKVALTHIGPKRVSTVFLGLDHAFGSGPPVLWETMVFEDDSMMNLECDRCSGSLEQAEAMHQAMVAQVEAINPF